MWHQILYYFVFYPEVEEDEKPMGTGGYNSVAFSYGNTDDSADHKITDARMESSGYLPPFPVPENLLQSLVSMCSLI